MNTSKVIAACRKQYGSTVQQNLESFVIGGRNRRQSKYLNYIDFYKCGETWREPAKLCDRNF